MTSFEEKQTIETPKENNKRWLIIIASVLAVVISLFSHRVMKKHPILSSGIGVSISAVIMVVGYSLGRAFLYSTPEYALLKLPYQILQAGLGAIVGMLLCRRFGVHHARRAHLVPQERITQKSPFCR